MKRLTWWLALASVTCAAVKKHQKYWLKEQKKIEVKGAFVLFSRKIRRTLMQPIIINDIFQKNMPDGSLRTYRVVLAHGDILQIKREAPDEPAVAYPSFQSTTHKLISSGYLHSRPQ